VPRLRGNSRIRRLLRLSRDRVDVDAIDDELRFHLESRAAELTAAGMPEADARALALQDFGDWTRHRDEVVAIDRRSSRETHMRELRESVASDVRHAVRGLRRHPWFALAVIVTLGAGVGVNAALFSVLDRLFLRPPAHLSDPPSVNRIYESALGANGERTFDRQFSYAAYQDLARWSHTSSDMAAFLSRRTAIGDGDAVRLDRFAAVSASYFGFFDVHPALGRFFAADEDRIPTGERVTVLADGYWRANFGARDVIGKTIRIGENPYTIIGVAPPGFDGINDGQPPALFIPLTAYASSGSPRFYDDYTWTNLEIMARRKSGVTSAEASADLTTALRRSWNVRHAVDASLQPAEIARPFAVAGPIAVGRGPMATPEDKVVLWVGAVAFAVLLIACANVANLLLARSLRRRREMAMRRAIGGSRRRLVQQLLTETMVLALLGTGVGLGAAALSAGALRRLLVDDGAEWPVVTDGRTLVFSLGLAVFVTFCAGLVPAFFGSTDDVADTLRGSRHHVSHTPLRSALLVVQTALATVLLIGAGLFVRSLQHVEALPMGYDAGHLLYIEASMRGTELDTAQSRALSDRLLARIQSTPEVAAATPIESVPFYAGDRRSLYVAGIDSVSKLGRFSLQAGTAEYFATMRTRVLRGRGIQAEDRAESPRVTVVSAAMAKALWGQTSPIGQCLHIGQESGPCTTVVGVAENTRTRSITGENEFMYYLPMSQYRAAFGAPMMVAFMARVHGSPEPAAEHLRATLQALMPGTSFVRAQPFHEIVDPTMRSWTSGARMFMLLGALALALAAIGLYAVIAFSVAGRTRELGVRVALGARRADIVRLVVLDGTGLTALGLVLGFAIAWQASKTMTDLLFRVSAHDVFSYITVGVTLLIVGVLASAVPAFRAANVDPNGALRLD
jgi:putative ABC transport system permease protein